MGNLNKRNEMMIHFDNVKPDIILLSDIRLDTRLQTQMTNNLNFNAFYNSHSSNSRGVAILIKKSSLVKAEVIYKDNGSNILILKCNYDNKNFILASIYGPNVDDPEFYTNLFNLILSYNEASMKFLLWRLSILEN